MDPDAPQYPRYPGEHQGDAEDVTTGRGTTGDRSGRPDVRTDAPVHVTPTDPSAHEEPAGWWIRALAAVVDALIVLALSLVPVVGGLVLFFVGSDYDAVTDEFTDTNPWGLVGVGVGLLVYLGVDLWNRGLRVGYRGQSLGKQLVGVHVVGRDGAPVGALEGFFRWLVAGLLQWTVIGLLVDLLWPLWDERKQTVHDKAINTFPVRR